MSWASRHRDLLQTLAEHIVAEAFHRIFPAAQAAIHAHQDATHRDEGDAIEILVDVNQASESIDPKIP